MTESKVSGPESTPTSAWSSELEAIFKQLQDETILLALPGLCVAGLILLGSTPQFPDPVWSVLTGIGLFLLAVIVWVLRRWSYLAAAWMLVAGCLVADLLVVAWSGLGPALCLLAIPVGLATLTVGTAAGLATAVVCTLWVLLPPAASLPVTATLRTIALTGIWSTVGMIWLTLRPLLTAVEWAWSGYERNQTLLEQARDYQVQLQQTLEDLTVANRQLTRLNRQVEGLHQAAEEARRAKEQFVANVSHELRTPLNMVIGFSEAIVEAPQTYGGNISPALLADLNVILRNSQHLSSLIDDVLDLSQIEAGQMALTKERTVLREIIEAATVAVRPLFESKGLYLDTEVSEDLPPVFCDRTRIREVVLNLLSNAGRFTERGGVHVRARRERNDIVVSVADTGPGIADEDKDRLFQRFQQLDGSIRRRYGGSGLGLSISKSFVELHGGKMWLESAIGAGTTFFFTLPIDLPPPVDGGATRWLSPDWEYVERTHRSLAPVTAVRPRLVVLETGDSLQRLLTRYLDNADIVPVTRLDEAIQQLSDVPAQALLVNDVAVNESLQRLNASAALPYSTPAIICSVPGAVEAADALGASDYLIKPISREALLTALDRLQLCGKTVLVVDDEPDALRLFWRILVSASRGYRVLTASDGHQALQILREQHPDAILLDLVMPDMDGFQVLAAKNEDPTLRDIPTVVISARDPAGQPIVSNALAVTRGGGLSIHQLLASIEALSRILTPTSQLGDLALTATLPG